MKKFKGKNPRKHFFLKLFFYIFIIIISFIVTVKFLFDFKLKSSNEEFVKEMLMASNYYEAYQQNQFSKFIDYLLNIDLKSPKTLLSSFFKYENKDKKQKNKEYALENNSINPKIYIYNTHQSENYNLENYQDYNITPNVQMASFLLKGLLDKEGIDTIVEEASISDFLSLNGWNYAYSYEASKYYILEALKKYNNLDLLIDIHRDSISKEKATAIIDDKKFAKVLFVIGTDNPNYNANLKLVEQINNKIKARYPDLTRGIITKGGSGVNGVYNQDLNSKIILIELGSNENTIDEVMNTIVVLKDVIKEYIGEING